LSAGGRAGERRLVTVGRVGRPHGRDGSFYVDGAAHELPVGADVRVAHRLARVERRAGTAERPLVRVSGVEDREAAAALRGRLLRVAEAEAPLGRGEWLAGDLVGCRVDGLGEVRRVIAAPSCDLLEVGEERALVPLVSDAIRRVDVAGRTIEVDRGFLGLGEEAPGG
jgi:16S rRNA processing protein RimM